MKARTQSRFEKARRDLRAARRDLDAAGPDSALARGYYAAFHAASAALHERKLTARTHSGVGALFFAHVVDAGPLDRDLAQTLSGLQYQREAADYGVGVQATVAAATGWVDRSEAFVTAAEAMLAAP